VIPILETITKSSSDYERRACCSPSLRDGRFVGEIDSGTCARRTRSGRTYENRRVLVGVGEAGVEMIALVSAAVAHDPYAALRAENYRWFIVSLLTMTVSCRFQAVASPGRSTDITHDPLSARPHGVARGAAVHRFALLRRDSSPTGRPARVSLAAIAVLLACSIALLAFNLIPDFLRAARSRGRSTRLIFVAGIARASPAGAPSASAPS